MEYLSQASLVASSVVLFVTQALKYVPVEWTTRYAVWVNIVLSIIGTIVIKGEPTFTNWPDFAVQAGTIAVIAALAYNHLVRSAVTSPSVQK
jgi:hypothetical protein